MAAAAAEDDEVEVEVDKLFGCRRLEFLAIKIGSARDHFNSIADKVCFAALLSSVET
ncbi:uncharacterized protein ARB_06630 [Trichophyton benhamiae CBS 112371]|uniref:Uncharacterized protein n=1 Tax=Arthroderma benhamiae (strain ATCC MYA-4681 / CBS 112371) TaxID=663331 RepID=D4AQX0_ARTBC|nr:uncharacterized protein ARB_06630 [Trichophyton benhamiae CBS 112371]EFE34864.1 hypothetical protein ARB_06630 [Trichophyton benhamiae CBS 112371]